MVSDHDGLRLADLARAGFQDLTDSRTALGVLAERIAAPARRLLDDFSLAADPDTALTRITHLQELHPEVLSGLDLASFRRLTLLCGASPALGDFFARQPGRLREILEGGGRLIDAGEARTSLLAAVHDDRGDAIVGEPGWGALRVRYRELLSELMLHDLRSGREGGAPEQFEAIARSLSGLAAAAVEASLAVARAMLAAGGSGAHSDPERVAAVRLAIIAMGKCGAEELNVVSDVDVMFIAESLDDELIAGDALIRLAARLATETMRGIHGPGLEPPLWELDPNLRPEGRHGALVRTLGSMLSYYDRWAKAWEFQALLKARPLAGDLELGQDFVDRTRALVWASASREDFVGSVQRMRQRVTEHISEDELDIQLKLGPGGLRDIEFSVQLLQLVHGQYDERLHLRGTLPALRALVDGGYIARSDGERLASDYCVLRVLEHRLQLRDLRRTALMPQDPDELRTLARASGLATTGEQLSRQWDRVKREIRDLHLKIFYAPLLSAVAALPEEELVLGSEEARARLAGIGFRDPDGAMRHLTALTSGTSRRARIQRNLMPVALQMLADGTDPDFGLLAYRRVSEANAETPWYLRLLRDGTVTTERLMRVLSCSRYAAELLESIPEAVAWLEHDERLRPVPVETVIDEMHSLASRRANVDSAAEALRTVHRREVLRLALGRVVGVNGDGDVARGLDAAHTALLDALLMAVRQHEADEDIRDLELAIIGMGRFGGRELGFASDIDIIAVYRQPAEMSPERASGSAIRLVSELRRLISDPRFPVDLDFDLRPEGKNGALARSLDSYRSYYQRWSVTWEAQALLRARCVAGDALLGEDFLAIADAVRYPSRFGEDEVREVRRIKARVEAERLPQGADPRRHLKLGPGGISDVEWLVQLLQLRHAARLRELRTVSTLQALSAAEQHELLGSEDVDCLAQAWILASRIRSAIRLWSGRSSDSLPASWNDLSGIAELLGIPSGHVSELEERWFTVSRRARAVFSREFFGYTDERLHLLQ